MKRTLSCNAADLDDGDISVVQGPNDPGASIPLEAEQMCQETRRHSWNRTIAPNVLWCSSCGQARRVCFHNNHNRPHKREYGLSHSRLSQERW